MKKKMFSPISISYTNPDLQDEQYLHTVCKDVCLHKEPYNLSCELCWEGKGSSSRFLERHMLNKRAKGVIFKLCPSDSDDFSRLYDLFLLHPEWKERLDEMKIYGEEWTAFVNNYSLYERYFIGGYLIELDNLMRGINTLPLPIVDLSNNPYIKKENYFYIGSLIPQEFDELMPSVIFSKVPEMIKTKIYKKENVYERNLRIRNSKPKSCDIKEKMHNLSQKNQMERNELAYKMAKKISEGQEVTREEIKESKSKERGTDFFHSFLPEFQEMLNSWLQLYNTTINVHRTNVDTDTMNVNTDTMNVDTNTTNVDTDTTNVDTDTMNVNTDTMNVNTDTTNENTEKVMEELKEGAEQLRSLSIFFPEVNLDEVNSFLSAHKENYNEEIKVHEEMEDFIKENTDVWSNISYSTCPHYILTNENEEENVERKMYFATLVRDDVKDGVRDVVRDDVRDDEIFYALVSLSDYFHEIIKDDFEWQGFTWSLSLSPVQTNIFYDEGIMNA
jgi:hypothetical protein